MEKDVYADLMQKVEFIEKNFGSLENFVILSTWGHGGHKLIVEEDYSSSLDLSAVYRELSDLELADLEDYKNFLGRFDGEYF